MTKKTTPEQSKRFSCSHPSFFSVRLSSIIAIILLLGIVGFLYAKKQELERRYEEQNQSSVIELTTTDVPTPIPTSTPIPLKKNQPKSATKPAEKENNSIGLWGLKKEDESLTVANIPDDDRMSTPDELFEAMNDFRKAHNLQSLNKSVLLCEMAQNRITTIEKIRKATHEGFSEEIDKYMERLASERFQQLPTEVVFYGGPLYGVHIVEYGWNRSLTGHAEVIKNPSFNQGCGWTGPHSAVFLFGIK